MKLRLQLSGSEKVVFAAKNEVWNGKRFEGIGKLFRRSRAGI